MKEEAGPHHRAPRKTREPEMSFPARPACRGNENESSPQKRPSDYARGRRAVTAIPEHKLSAANVRTAVRVPGRPGSLRPLLLLLLKNRRFQIWKHQ